MKPQGWLSFLCIVVCTSGVHAQDDAGDKGFELGFLQIFPRLELLGAYDRDENADDFYGEVTASVNFNNSEARYGIEGSGHYGYRIYEELSPGNDDFYGLGCGLSSQQSPLKLGISGYHAKTIDYDIQGNDGNESPDPATVLTAGRSTRATARVNAEYEWAVSEKTALLPGYAAMYHQQSFDGGDDLDWHEHSASLRVGYMISSRTLISLLGSYDVQRGYYEDGSVANVSMGAQNKYSDKLSLEALIGLAVADYENSGSDQGMEGSLNVSWQATDKISTYVFSASEYQPGMERFGARQVFRTGYGGGWQLFDRVGLSLQILHDRQKDIQTDTTLTRHFASGQLEFDMGSNITLTLAGLHIEEEEEADRQVISCGALAVF